MEYKNRSEVPNEFKWNLSSMYKDINEVNQDIEEVNVLTPKILEYKSHIMDSSDTLYNFLKLTEKQDRLLEKLYIYSKMNLDVDTKDNDRKALNMKIEKLSEDISEKYSFIEPEMMDFDYSKVKDYIKEGTEDGGKD